MRTVTFDRYAPAYCQEGDTIHFYAIGVMPMDEFTSRKMDSWVCPTCGRPDCSEDDCFGGVAEMDVPAPEPWEAVFDGPLDSRTDL